MKDVITSKQGILSLLRSVVMIILGTGFAILSALISNALLSDFDVTGLIGLCFYILFGFTGLFVGFSTIKKISIIQNDRLIVIRRFGIFSNSFHASDMKGIRSFTHRTKYKSYKAFFIETSSGAQIAFTEVELANFDQIRNTITAMVSRNPSLKRNPWLVGDKKIMWLTLATVVAIFMATPTTKWLLNV